MDRTKYSTMHVYLSTFSILCLKAYLLFFLICARWIQASSLAGQVATIAVFYHLLGCDTL
jgi:hypothetical protein